MADQKLTEEEIAEALERAPGWKHEDGKLTREWTFADFRQAMLFVERVADAAEAAGHHPDIDIRYNRVKLGLVSHDAGGITARDAAMAVKLTGL